MQSLPQRPRLAVLASGIERRDHLVDMCRALLPAASIEPVHDMVDLVIRVASLDTDAVVIDGGQPACLPAEGAIVLKGLCAGLKVALVAPDARVPVPHGIDVLLDHGQLAGWLALTFDGKPT